MSDAPGDAAYAEYLERMLAHEPEMRLARALVRSQREPCVEALQVLDTLLLDAALEVRDTGVALAKLGWWHDELARALAGAGRHPVARRLVQAGVRDADALAARVDAAGAIARLESPPDDAALLAPFIRYARASAAADTLAGTAEARGAAYLTMRVRRWPAFAPPQRARIPLATLARGGFSRDAVACDPVASAAAIESLALALAGMIGAATSADDARVVCARHVLRALRRDPRRAAGGDVRARPVPLLIALWRIARRERSA
ncbi:MAG TPA: hypothetical protein VND91_09190 [Candidatus Saccharimonadia bacterium]|nr:hypothetical protein [Candidatus Saccharimonadia bacterium]